ncbi:hypothetical protein CO671_15160 [Rhizobium sp. M10]|uniref:hypothetical protein n=1 Tax=Rhizobium sp. M10 TaxID=1324586 RepID=UPI000BEA65EB|nr:hypothetical protein [Rhizobium sp. M10]PDT35652.1 hypothetical protein CO671_15160 [Rhizobium sp. M10]
MTGNQDLHNIRIVAPAPVPYHFRVVAMERANIGADLLSDKDGVAETQLQSGTFLCYAEDLTTGALLTTKIDVYRDSPSPLIVPLGDKPRQTSVESNFRPSRIEAYRAFRTAASVLEEVDEDLVPVVSPNLAEFSLKQFSSAMTPLTSRLTKRFSIGLSIDLTSAKRGGWRAFNDFDGLASRKDGNQLILDFSALARRPKERLRLSVSVEGDPAWQVNLPQFDSGLQTEIRLVRSAFGPELTLRLIAPDPSLALVLSGSRGPYPGVEKVSGFRARDQAKLNADPWTDLSWALADIRAGIVPRRLRDGPWPWKKFDPISDGYVVWAWMVASTTDKTTISLDQRCLEALVQARRLGMPYFSATSDLAVDLLQALASSSKDGAVRASAKYEAALWRRRGRTKLRTGPFFAWERSGGGLQTGKLPLPTYNTLASGKMDLDVLHVDLP